MTLKEHISRIIALGMYDKMTTPTLPLDVNHYVSAGNPGKTFSQYPASLPIPDTFIMGKSLCNRNDYNLYTVFGNSMLPEGISSGYELLTQRVMSEQVRLGDFIIIEVDRSYYQKRHHGKKPHFDQKLRRAICPVENTMTIEQLLATLKGTFAEPLEKKEKKDLRDSLNEAREFYHDTQLFLSITYHDGDIHYSFHPSDHIRYRVEGAAYSNDNVIVFKTASEIAE